MNNRAFGFVELILSMTIGVVLLVSMHSLHMHVFLWFVKSVDNMEMKAKGFFIKNLIDSRISRADLVNLCTSSDIGCIYRLPKYMQDIISSGNISSGSSILCLNEVKEEVAKIEHWEKYWARYIEVDSADQIREKDNISIVSGNCITKAKVIGKTDKKILLSVPPEYKLEKGASIYRYFYSCFFLLRRKTYSSIYLYEENRNIMGLLDKVTKFEILSNYDLKIAGNREYHFHKR